MRSSNVLNSMSGRRYQRLATAFTICLGAALAVEPKAFGGDCVVQTLDLYAGADGKGNNYTCSIRTRNFSGFKVPAATLNGLKLNQITVTPLGLNDDTGAGFRFTGPFATGDGTGKEPIALSFGITYLVESQVAITDVHLAINGITNKGTPPGGYTFNSFLIYDIGNTGTSATSDTLQLFLATKADVKSKKISADFTGAKKIGVVQTGQNVPGTGFALSGAGNVVGSIEHRFTPNPKP